LDGKAFDEAIRRLTTRISRRGLWRAATGAALGTAVAGVSAPAEAKKKRAKKKPALNSFGCLNVGQKCRGNSGLCCSGICQGKKPKQGKKDKSQCIAHDTGDCQAGQDSCLAEEQTPCGTNGGACVRTTGKASFCGGGSGACIACEKDTDCQTLGFGENAACVVCRSVCPETITICLTSLA
jgi:hypothetical protein